MSPGCRRLAAVTVMVGDIVNRQRRARGSYCVVHSVIETRALRTRTTSDVWLTVIGREAVRGPM